MYEIKKKNRPWLDALFTVDPESTFSTMARPPSLSIAFTSTREQPSGADALGPRSLSLKVGEQLRPAVLGLNIFSRVPSRVPPSPAPASPFNPKLIEGVRQLAEDYRRRNGLPLSAQVTSIKHRFI
jgi:hypothetical protein